MENEAAVDLLRRKPRIFWGRVIHVLIRRGWTPPPPDERIVEDLMEAMEHLSMPLKDRLERDDRFTGLTQMERTVCLLLLEGMSNRQMAEHLGLAQNSIKFHLTNIYAKLSVHSRTEAVLMLTNGK